MSEEKKTIWATASSSSTASVPTLEQIQKTMNRLENQQLASIRGLCEGIRVIPDHTGMMVSPDEYIVVAGERLYKKLKGEP